MYHHARNPTRHLRWRGTSSPRRFVVDRFAVEGCDVTIDMMGHLHNFSMANITLSQVAINDLLKFLLEQVVEEHVNLYLHPVVEIEERVRSVEGSLFSSIGESLALPGYERTTSDSSHAFVPG